MSLYDCIQRAVDAGEADPDRGKAAQDLWRERRDRYRRMGHDEQMADALAAEDVKAAFRKKAGDDRHRFLAQASVQAKIKARVNSAKDLSTLATSQVEYMSHRPNSVTSVQGQVNALRRLFHSRLSDLILKHNRNLAGNSKDLPGLLNIARELHGQATGDASAAAIAKGVQEAFSEMRRMFNEAGGLIGKLDDWGLPHVHDPLSVTRAGFQNWADEIRGKIAWHRIEDSLTGRPLAAEGAMPSLDTQDFFLRSVYDNIAFGEGSREAVYGRLAGKNLVRQHGEARVLHFKTADDWIDYNKKFGTGDVYGSIIAHAHRMAEDIVTMREFGASPELGLEFQEQLAIKRAREMGDEALADQIRGNHEHARRMLRIMRGGVRPLTRRSAAIASFFSSTRHVLSAALLDRAIISSITDTNTMRMAAKSMGMQQGAPFKRHMDLLVNGASREQMLRAGWVADTLTDAGLVLSRWQSEVPPAAIAERISSGVMRAQGLAHWTDQGRIAFQAEMAGYMASFAGRKIADVDEPLRSLLIGRGVSEDEWAAFTRHMFTAPNGATFASPLWWREATDLPDDQADTLFLKMQSLIEEQTEIAVPTQSLWARAGIEGDLPPGSLGYEIAKSALMVKSFMMTFTVNQTSRIMAQQGAKARAGYAFDLLAGATLMGAVALQIGEMTYGRDPQDMTDPSFWGRAALKGGGFGVVGDIIAAGESSWGGGFQSFLTGPGIQLVGDTWALSVGNAVELMTGDETNFGRELVKFLDRYTPGADIPVLGLAMDRLFWDSLQKVLDPEAETAMRKAATKRENLYGNAPYWQPGRPLPGRAPNLGAAIGG